MKLLPVLVRFWTLADAAIPAAWLLTPPRSRRQRLATWVMGRYCRYREQLELQPLPYGRPKTKPRPREKKHVKGAAA